MPLCVTPCKYQSQMTFEPTAVTDEASLAHWLGAPAGHDADKVWEVAEETAAVIVRLDSSWWGNEAFDVWQELFFVYPEGVSPSGKALFVTHGVALRDPVRKLRSAERIRNERSGLTSNAARDYERRATKWHDHSELPGPGMPPTHERPDFWDKTIPLSAIESAVVTPTGRDALDADVRTAGRIENQYGTKTVLSGDTYRVFSESGVSDDVDWDTAHLSFDGEYGRWICDHDKDSHEEILSALDAAGFTGYGFLK